jgi:hypothetical protein
MYRKMFQTEAVAANVMNICSYFFLFQSSHFKILKWSCIQVRPRNAPYRTS